MKKIKLLLTSFLIAFVIIFGACKKQQDTSGKPNTLAYYQPFTTNAFFYDSIPASATIDANSTIMVGSLVDQANQGFVIAVKEWSVAVFFADASTKTSDVKLTASWSPKKRLLNVPIPEFAEPDPANDGAMVIIDEAGGCAYDFWQMKYSKGKWKASWANAIPLNGNGIFPTGLSARGSGFELLHGLIWPQELEAGVINHALIFSYDHTKAGGPVAPATESDGTTTDAWAIPEGARVRLDPTLDLTTLGLNTYEITIAKAMQKYGMFCGDDGGGLQLYAVNPISCKTNPYANFWGDQILVDISKIPANKFQVLTLGVQTATEATLSSNSCANYK